MKEYFSQAVYDYNKNKMCDLRDSHIEAPGQAEDIQMISETSGWKEMSFKLPTTVGGERNFRQDYMHPEYLLRVVEGDYVDWYVINEPSDTRNNKGYTITITAVHNSALLKTKNLYLAFDDTNGIGKVNVQANRILTGTDWSLGLCDTLYESDGVTEKVRSLQSDGKQGAYQLQLDLCELFMCYPTFHGDTKKVDIHSLAAKDGMMEFNFGSNIKSIVRKRNSANLVTRLYVEGEYTDDGEYVGIEKVNPTGLNFIFNFDYFKSLGVFTDEHQEMVDEYLSSAQNITSEILENSTSLQSKYSELNTLWGMIDYVVYQVANGNVQDVTRGGEASEEDESFSKGDALVCVINNSGTITTQEIECPANAEPVWPSNTVYAIKYILPAAGKIGGKEVAVEAKEGTLATLNEKLNDPDISDIQKEKYRELIASTTQEMNALLTGEDGLYAATYNACVLAFEINALNDSISSLQEQQIDIEADLVINLGDMLRDGYWSNNNYVPGQEQALYDDALAISEEMAKPEYTYTITILDLSELDGHECDTLKTNQQIRFYDNEIPLNDYAYITKIVNHPMQKYKNTMEVSTSAVSATRSSFQSSFNRINQIAQLVEEKKQIYARASALTERGQLSAAALDGIIDVNRVQILSTMSNWYTDENGNMLFEALDGGSAMLLSGSGFAIADTKREDGSWNWRTFGNGNGFTADEINTGTLNAGQITILGTADFFWDADSIRIYTNGDETEQIRIGRYDGVNYGIAFTKDGGSTWTTALTADGLVVGYGSLDSDLQNVFTQQGGVTVIKGGSIQTGTITVDKVSSSFGESLDLSSNTGINLTVSTLNGKITTAQNTANSASTAASSATSTANEAKASVTSLQVAVDEISTSVSDIDGRLTTTSQKVGEISTSVSDIDGRLTTTSQTVDEISTSVSDIDGRLTTTSQKVGEISTSVSDIDDRLTTTTQTADKINWVVASGTSAADMTMTDRAYTVIANNINLNGNTTFTNLVNGLSSGTTTISGGCITTGTISADRIDTSGISVSSISSGGTTLTVDSSGMSLYVNGINVGGIISTDSAMGVIGNIGNSLQLSAGDEVNMVGGTATLDLYTGTYRTTGGDYVYSAPIIGVGGNVIPNENSAGSKSGYQLGGYNSKWKYIFCNDPSIKTGSDRALKHDIKELKSLELLRNLKPVSFILNGDEYNQTHFGFIAQDVRDALENTQYENAAVFDGGGGEGNFCLLYGEVISPLVEGWQAHEKTISEQQKKIDELEQRLAAIEAKING